MSTSDHRFRFMVPRDATAQEAVAYYVWCDVETRCWNWLGAISKHGYGTARQRFGTAAAHRISYIAYVGPIPPGMQVDHLCRNRSCVNPDHLEPVTPEENMHRVFGAISRRTGLTYCAKGHPMSGEGRVGYCRPCAVEYMHFLRRDELAGTAVAA